MVRGHSRTRLCCLVGGGCFEIPQQSLLPLQGHISSFWYAVGCLASVLIQITVFQGIERRGSGTLLAFPPVKDLFCICAFVDFFLMHDLLWGCTVRLSKEAIVLRRSHGFARMPHYHMPAGEGPLLLLFFF